MIFTRILNWLSLCLAGALLLTSLTFSYLLVAPVDILDNVSWKLTVPNGVYKLGDTFTMEVDYKKLRDITGKPYFYMECLTQSGSLKRYPAYSLEAGNRSKGVGQADVTIQLPKDAPLLKLPTQCRVAVVVDYEIYSFRKFTEHNQSNYFEVTE